jgi:hypothetical protein
VTAMQWECLLAASHGNGSRAHGKTIASLVSAGFLRWESGCGLVPTTKGRNQLFAKYPAGAIGKAGAP